MYCKKCGAQLEEGSNFCEVCGNPISKQNNSVDISAPIKAEGVIKTDAPQTEKTSIPRKRPKICCMDCGSTELQTVNETSVNMQASFSNKPRGLFSGGNKISVTSDNINLFICMQCGRSFKNPKPLRAKSDQQYQTSQKIGKVLTVVMLVFVFITYMVTKSFIGGLAILIPAIIGTQIGNYLAKKRWEKQQAEAQMIEDAIAARLAQME